MHEIDHVTGGAILLVSVVQAFADPEFLKRAARMTFYKAGAATGLAMGLLVLAMWTVAGRPVAEFGLFGWIDRAPLTTMLAAVAWPLFLAALAWLLLNRFRTAATKFYSGYGHLMPHSGKELPVAYATAACAGFGEEIAYRGFLIWYLQAFAGLGAAVLGSSVIFGIAHGYQGKLGMVFASLAGLILAATYIVSESLLLVLWMHATYNIASFTVGYRLLHGR